MSIQRILPEQFTSLLELLKTLPKYGPEEESAYNYDVVSLATDGQQTTAKVIRRKYHMGRHFSNPYHEETPMGFRWIGGKKMKWEQMS